MRSHTRLLLASAVFLSVGTFALADGPEEVRAKRLRDQLPAIDAGR